MTSAPTTRERRKAETRAALLDAGRAVFVRDGFHGASLDRVAAEAGYTKGAVYAHFATKADLLLAIYEERSRARAEAIRRAAAGATADELRARMVGDWTEVMRAERGWSLLLVEFWVHAARHPELRERLRLAHDEVRDAMAAAIGATRPAGQTPALPDDELATAVMALGNGLNLEAFLAGDEPVDGDLYDRAATALVLA